MAASHVEIFVDPPSTKSALIQLKSSRNEVNHIQQDERLFSNAGGGFKYKNQTKFTRNRYINWRVVDNVIELEELGFDYSLFGNKLEIVVSGEILLPNVKLYEDDQEIHIFFATLYSMHEVKLKYISASNDFSYILPTEMNVTLPSVFYQAETKYVHNHKVLPQSCHNFDVTMKEHVYFAMITDTKSLLVASLYSDEDEFIELKDTSLMQRLLTGLVPSFVRGDGSWMGVDDAIIHTFGNGEVYAFAFCKDLKIRVWDIKNKTCIQIKDLYELIPEKVENQPENVGFLTLKKAECSSSSQMTLAAHCCFAYSSQFIVLEVFQESSNIIIMHVSSFFSDFNHIQDIAITNQYLWALWCSPDGDHSVSYAPIEGGKDFERGWHNVKLKERSGDEVYVPLNKDPKEVYMEKLFSPLAYNKESLIKALQVFTKSNHCGNNDIPDETADLAMMKESVSKILDKEIEKTFQSIDIRGIDHQELKNQCWSKFYSFVQQCYQFREKPLGIFADDTNNTATIIRKDMLGYLYYNEWSDHLYQIDLEISEGVTSFIDNELEINGDIISYDILSIFECMKAIRNQFPNEIMYGIDKDFDNNEDMTIFLSAMASALLTNSSDFEQLIGDSIKRGEFLVQVEGRLKNINNPEKAIELILTSLESVDFEATSVNDHSEVMSPYKNNKLQFFSCQNGAHLVSNILAHVSLHRMHLLRDLYVLIKLMESVAIKLTIDGNKSKDLNLLTSVSCYELLKSYHTIYWSASHAFIKVNSDSLDANLSSLANLNLTERSPLSNTARKIVVDEGECYPLSYLYKFIHDFGLQNSLQYITEANMNMLKPGDYSVNEMLKLIIKVLSNEMWPLNEKSSDFPEYLVAHTQYSALNHYMHLCDDWCQVNRGTKDFFLAQSYLGKNDPEKALLLYISASKGISQREPLILKLLEVTEDSFNEVDEYEFRQQLLVDYFIKVMRIYEQYNYPEYVITAATKALTAAKKNNKNIVMLWSIIFKYNLQLENYSDAYSAIIHNSDKVRRHDCLRHFIVTLCERELFQKITAYPYIGLEEEVVEILERRARTMDITVNKYYDILYSYHVMKSDYRKGATAMYEQACRLSREMHGLESLQKQAKCYLATLTSLALVEEKYAWIIKPQEKLSSSKTYVEKSSSDSYSRSPKRKENGEEVYYSSIKKRRHTTTIVLELSDIEKEYILILARLKLVQYGKTDALALGPGLTSKELIGLLSQTGLYDMAFSIAMKFKLPYKNIFESISGKCGNLSYSHKSNIDSDWKWLTLNEMSTPQLVTNQSASQQAHRLLQIYLSKYQEKKSSLLYKTVTAKLLSMGSTLPAWLIKEYKVRNPSELLHLYLCYDMVHEATQLALEYVDGVLGIGKEFLGMETALHATTPPVWLPYTYLDQLLAALKANHNKAESARMHDELQRKLDDYFAKLEIVSCDKLDYMHRSTSRLP